MGSGASKQPHYTPERGSARALRRLDRLDGKGTERERQSGEPTASGTQDQPTNREDRRGADRESGHLRRDDRPNCRDGGRLLRLLTGAPKRFPFLQSTVGGTEAVRRLVLSDNR